MGDLNNVNVIEEEATMRLYAGEGTSRAPVSHVEEGTRLKKS